MILKKVKNTIQEYGLLDIEDKILIAFSGGVDSTGLLQLLLELKEEWSFELFLAHFNHKLRKQAGEDERFVRRIARKYSLPLFVGSRDVRSFADERKMNIEEAGRKLRYDFLKKTALEVDGAKIATGHTMTDQAETFFMRLMRGSGLRGLGGIFPVKEGMIVRPLIKIERQDIEDYLSKKGIEYRVDESNFDRRFLRNRVRLELLPYLRENFEPKIVPLLEKISSIIREDDSLLEEITQEITPKTIIKEDSQFFLDLKSLSSLPRALSRRVVRSFITELRGSLREISFEDIESILSLAEGKEFPLKKGLVLRREQGRVFLKKETLPEIKYEYGWKGEELLEVKELQMKFEGKKVKKEDSLDLEFDDRTRAFLDLEKLRFPLLIRNRREGDRYQPLGAPGKKKLKEIMRAKDIPLRERARRPVFLSGDEIVWILGLPVSERFKIKKGKSDIFLIEKL